MDDKAGRDAARALSDAGLDDFLPLSPAEAEIVSSRRGFGIERVVDGLRPNEDSPERSVRAEFLRYLILRDCNSSSQGRGLKLSGAWITGILDLEGCRIPKDIGLKDCHFDSVPVLRAAIIDSLFLDGSRLPGLQADRLEARGSVSMKGSAFTGAVRMIGARLGGTLEADGVTLEWPGETALDVGGIEVRGNVLLRGARVKGSINLSSSRLGGGINAAGVHIERPGEIALNGDALAAEGDFVLSGANIAGETRLLSVRLGGDVNCTAVTLTQPAGFALRLNHAAITGAFVLREEAKVDGVLDLTAATIGAIDDDRQSWPAPENLLLNRCQYGAFIGGPVDAKSRLDWLGRQAPARWATDFWPQPYEHLSTVFSDMGHDEDAREVLVAKERLQRRARRGRTRSGPMRFLLTLGDGILKVTVSYGRQPLFALIWILLFWVVGIGVFFFAYKTGAMMPSSPVMLRSLEWTMCNLPDTQERYMPSSGQSWQGRARPGETQLTCFLNQPEASSYPEFNAGMYSLDVLLPVLSIGQKDYWRPNSMKPGGTFALRYFFFHSIIGWAFGLLAVAGFSGLVKSR
jgi:hypothetical protein